MDDDPAGQLETDYPTGAVQDEAGVFKDLVDAEMREAAALAKHAVKSKLPPAPTPGPTSASPTPTPAAASSSSSSSCSFLPATPVPVPALPEPVPDPPSVTKRSNIRFVRAVLGNTCFERMASSGYTVLYEARAGRFGHYVGKYWPMYPDKTVLTLLQGSSVQLKGIGQDFDSECITRIYNNFIVPDLDARARARVHLPPVVPAVDPGPVAAGSAGEGGTCGDGGDSSEVAFSDEVPDPPDVL